MSKNWYPIIDLDLCTGCLACVSFCTHNVYEVKDGKPYVANPYNCVEFCRGCQKVLVHLKLFNILEKIRISIINYIISYIIS